MFGCTAYLLKPPHTRDKFNAKSEVYIHVGYTHHGYRLWDNSKRKIICSRNITFDESNKSTKTNIEIEEEPYHEEEIPDHTLNIQKTNENECVNDEETIENQSEENKIKHNIKNTKMESSVRTRKQPHWLKDYQTSFSMALSADEIVDDLPVSYETAKHSKYHKEWEEAMQEEINSLKKNETWKLVKLPQGRKAIGNKWTFKIKHDSQGNINRYKARLVAKGFAQKEGVDYFETYSPVANINTIRLLLAVTNKQKLLIHQMDVTTAFLNSDLSEEVYMKQPEGYTEGSAELVCKLQKSIYGLKQASRQWNKRFNNFLESNDFKKLESDNCLYKSKDNNIYLAIYVDDILITGNNITEIEDIKS